MYHATHYSKSINVHWTIHLHNLKSYKIKWLEHSFYYFYDALFQFLIVWMAAYILHSERSDKYIDWCVFLH